MNARIFLMSVMASMISIETCWSSNIDEVDLYDFKSGQRAIAAEINSNFLIIRKAVSNNFNELLKLKNNRESDAENFNNDNAEYLVAGDWITTPQLQTNFSTCELTGLLIVPTGTTIRCQSGFTLAAGAEIVVSEGFGLGVARTQATNRIGGLALYQTTAASSFDAFPLGGAGDNGGGYLRIIADGDIVINGVIRASGNTGNSLSFDGGGAGGLIVLESNHEIDISAGLIYANGGSGAYRWLSLNKTNPDNSLVYISPDADPATIPNYIPQPQFSGGGGGGGIVVLVAESITAPEDSIRVQGGAAGINYENYNQENSTVILGGAASGGNGGETGSAGNVGYVIKINRTSTK